MITIMDLHKEIILSVFSRCRASSLRETLVRWGRLSSAQLNKLFSGGILTKRQAAEQIIKIVKKNAFSDEIIGDLELAYMQLHSESKTWAVYSLVGENVCLNLDPRTLRSKVFRSLQLIWKEGRVFGNMRPFSGAVWLRMNLGISMLRGKGETRSRIYNHNHSVFVVTFPGAPYVIINKTNVRLQKVVTEALLDAVNAVKLKDIKLSGRHISSLADIVLNKDSKVTLSKYRDMEELENPLLARRERKRKAFEDSICDTEDMIDEDRQVKRVRRNILEKTFGNEPQHVLEKLEYKFTLKFHGKPVCEEECKSSVEVKGKSVLDGLCQLALKGLVKFPLPKHLTTVTKSARNSFTIESTRKQQQGINN